MSAKSELRNLSQELWARVFAMLKPSIVGEQDPEFAAAAPQYYKLQLVSKSFREVFKQHPHLYSLVWLHGPSNGGSLKSLLQRLSTQPVAVKELAVHGASKQDQEIALAALLARPQRCSLATFSGHNLSATAIGFLAEFQSLTTCDLIHTQTDQPLDLSPLQGLQHLSRLQLQGIGSSPHFAGLHSLAYITALTLFGTTVGVVGSPACVFFSELRFLAISNGGILGAQSSGLPHCRKLCNLTLRGDTCIGGSCVANTWQMVQGRPIRVPLAMSSLTQLSIRIPISASHEPCAWGSSNCANAGSRVLLADKAMLQQREGTCN